MWNKLNHQWLTQAKKFGPISVALLPLLGSPVFAQTKPDAPAQPGGVGGPLSKIVFETAQKQGEWRATELDGLAVYDVNGEELGKIEDVLVTSSGQMTTVVISSGGFLGMGTNLVGVPFSAIQWNTEAMDGGVPAPPSGTQRPSNVDAVISTGGIPRRPTLPFAKGDLAHSPPPAFNYAGRALPTSNRSSEPDSNTSGNRLKPLPQAQ